MRKKLIIFISVLATLGIVGISQAQVSNPNLWKLLSNAIFPVKSTWEFGSATNRISKGWFNNLDANNANIGSIAVSGSVAGDMVVSGQIRNATGTAAAPSYAFNNDTNTGFYSGGSDILKLANGGSDSLTVLANGNMGVATATPTYKMDINGTLRANSTITFNSLASTTGTLIAASTTGTLSTVTDNRANWDAGYNYRVTSAVAPLSLSSNSLSIPAASASVNGYMSTSTFTTFNNKISSQWVTNGSNVYYTTGSVGIGTTNPLMSLQVQVPNSSNQGITLNRLTTNTGDDVGLYFQLSTSPSTSTNQYGAIKGIRVGGLSFWDGGTTGTLSEGMRLFKGNLGIGTTNPGSSLEVNGNILLSQGANRTIGIPAVASNVVGNNLSIYAGTGGAGSSPTNGGSLYLSGGNGSAVTSTNYGGNVYLYGGSGTGSGGVSGNVILAHNGTTTIGSVGIGTTGPTEKLEVNGNIKATGYKSSDGTIGTSTTITTRNSADTGTCTITVKNGLITGTTCL